MRRNGLGEMWWYLGQQRQQQWKPSHENLGLARPGQTEQLLTNYTNCYQKRAWSLSEGIAAYEVASTCVQADSMATCLALGHVK
ncbi:hypothetical protein LIA77_11596 [Sarocladium implicatum]|nr:hypothetical protein LIA77_11596 [Sarocladium implicatum]